MPDINKLVEQANNGELQNVTLQDSFTNAYETFNTKKESAPFEEVIGRHRNSNRVITPEFTGAVKDIGASLSDNDIYTDDFSLIEDKKLKHLAEEQSGLAQFGNALVQLIGSDFAVGTVKGIFDLIDAGVNIFTDEHYQSGIDKFFEGWQDSIREFAPIHSYKRGDSGWWWQGLEQIGSVASIAIPVGGWAKGLGFLGKAMKASKFVPGALSKAGKAIAATEKGAKFIERGAGLGKILKYPNYYGRAVNNALDAAGLALMSRAIENQQEANETYKIGLADIQESFKYFDDADWAEFIKRNPEYVNYVKDGKFDSERIAIDMASKAADKVFGNDMLLLAMDIMQWNAINKLFKGFATRNIGGAAQRANREAIKKALKTSVGETAEQDSKKSLLQNVGSISKKGGFWIKDHSKELTLELVGEGFEEGFQGIQQGVAENAYQMALDKNVPLRGLDSYLTDPVIWDQFIWGAIGGVLGGGGMKLLNNKWNKHKVNKLHDKKKINDVQYNEYIRSEDQKAEDEINGRTSNILKLNEWYNSIENGINPFADSNNNKINTQEEAEVLKEEALDRAVDELVMNAVNAGTVHLLTEYLNADAVKQMIDSQGNADVTSEKLINRFNEVYKLYSENLEDLLNNTSVDNPDLLKIMAKDLTRLDLNLKREQKAVDLENANLGLMTGQQPSQNIRDYVGFQYYNAILSQIDKAVESATKKHEKGELDTYGYNTELVRLDELKKNYTDLLKNFLNEKEALDILESVNNNDFDSAKSKAKDKWFNEQEWKDIPNNIKQQLQQVTEKQIVLDNKKALRPQTQNDFNKYYANYEQTAAAALNTVVGNAFTTITDYLKNAEDIDNAINVLFGKAQDPNLSKREQKKLEKSMDILSIGTSNNALVTETLAAAISKIKTDREVAAIKEQEGSNGETVTENPVKDGPHINDAPVKEEKEKPSSKKEEKADDEEDFGGTIYSEEIINDDDEAMPFGEDEVATNPDDDYESGDFIGQSWAERQLDSRVQQAQLEKDVQTAFKELAREGKIPLSSVIENGIGSQDFRDFVEAAVQYLVTMYGYSQEEIRNNITYDFTVFLNKFVGDNSSLNKESKTKIYKMINDLTNIANTYIVKDDFSEISLKSEKQRNREIEEFLDKYFDLSGYIKQTTVGGLKIININALLNDILTLLDDGTYTFAQVCEIFNNIANYINYSKQHPSSKYAFVFTDSVDSFLLSNTITSKTLNLTEFINRAHANATSNRVLDNHMHFSLSNLLYKKDENGEYIRNNRGQRVLDVQKLNGAKGKRLFIKDAGEGSISLYYLDSKGNEQEIGYLSKVIANPSNTELKIAARQNLMHRVKKVDGEYKMVNEALEKMLADLIDSSNKTSGALKQVFDCLYDSFLFQSHRGNVFSDSIRNHYIKMLSNPEFKKLYELMKEEVDLPDINFDKKQLDNENGQAILATINKLNNIIFYPYNTNRDMGDGVNSEVLISSLENYIERTFKNYLQTLDFQTKLSKGEHVAGFKFIATDENKLRYDPHTKLKNIGDIGLKGSIKDHPFVMVTTDNTIVAEGIDKPFDNTPGWRPYSTGILLDVKNNSPMVALFYESCGISNKISAALQKEFTNRIEKYFNATGTDVETEYNNLFNFFKNVFYSGEGTLFTGWKLSDNGNHFDIYSEIESDDGETIKVPLARFYKYKIYRDTKTNEFKHIITGEKIEPSDFQNHYGGRVSFMKEGTDKKTRITVSGLNNKKQKDAIDFLYKKFASQLTYNRFGFKAIENDSGFVKKTNDGFIVQIGNYKEKFVNFADWAVKNNAFTTSHQGTRVTSTYITGNDSGSVYVEYSGAREDITPEEKRSLVGILFNFDERGIKDGDKISTNDFLLDAGYTEKELNNYKDLLEALEVGDIKIDLSTETKAFASHSKGTIKLTKRGVELTNGNKEEGLRLVIHENVHRVVDKEKFFEGTRGKVHADLLVDTYKQFYDYIQEHPELLKENESLDNFVSNFESRYGVNKDNADENKQIELANEWIAEVLSNAYLANLLNSIPYQGSYVIKEDTEHQSLFDKIIEVIKKLFLKLGQIHKDNLLDQFTKAIKSESYTSITQIEENVNSEQEEESEQEDKGSDLYTGDIDDLFINDMMDGDVTNFSTIEGVSEEVEFNSFLDDTKNNPYGFKLAPTVDDYLQSIPMEYRAKIAAELTAGRVEYLCR